MHAASSLITTSISVAKGHRFFGSCAKRCALARARSLPCSAGSRSREASEVERFQLGFGFSLQWSLVSNARLQVGIACQSGKHQVRSVHVSTQGFSRKDSLLLCKCSENCALSMVTDLSRYRTINKNSHVDESLFGNKSPIKSSASDNKASPGKAVKSPTSKLSPNTALLPIQADVVTIRRYAGLPCRANSMPSTTKPQSCANIMIWVCHLAITLFRAAITLSVLVASSLAQVLYDCRQLHHMQCCRQFSAEEVG